MYESLAKLSYKDKEKYEKLYQSRFTSEAATVFDFYIGENKSFYLLTPEIMSLITNIAKTDKLLTNITNVLPKVAVEQFSKQSLIDEIKQTNEIERVHSTRKEIAETLYKVEENKSGGRFNGLLKQYLNFRQNTDILLDTCADIRTLYDEIVLPEVISDDPKAVPDGMYFRKESASVYSASDKEIHKGVYPEERIIEYMQKSLLILKDENLNNLIAASVFHYMFEYIHPFYDGNGRTGRFISAYYLSKNLNSLVSYKLSYVIKNHINKYYNMFEETNNPKNKGDLTPFITGFLEFVLEAEQETYESLNEKREMLLVFEKKLDNSSFSQKEREVLYILIQVALFKKRPIPTKELVWAVGKSNDTAKHILNTLIEKKIVKCEKEGKSNVYSVDLETI